MFRKLFPPLFVLMAVASMMLAPAASAGSKEVNVENLKQAYASIYTENGCYRLSGVVSIGQGSTKSNTGEQRSYAHGWGYIDVYDACEKQWVLMSEMGGDDLNVSIAPSLRSATIDDTFLARDYQNDVDVSIAVSLVWEGSGKKFHGRDVVEVEYPGPNGTTVHSISKAGFQSVSARATGTITIDGHEFTVQTDDADIVGVKGNTHQTYK